MAAKDRWARKLPRTVRSRDGRALATLGDVRGLVLALPAERLQRNAWHRIAALLLDEQASGEAIALQLEFALLMDAKLELTSETLIGIADQLGQFEDEKAYQRRERKRRNNVVPLKRKRTAGR